MPRLLVVTARELTQDIRARRQVEAALAHGWEVAGLSLQTAGDRPAPFVDLPIVRVGGDRVGGTLRRAGLGGFRSSPPAVRELRGLFRLARLARASLALSSAARPLGRFDVVHANDLDSLPGATLIARRLGARLVYDSHELYTVMEADPPRLYRAAVSALERALAQRAAAVVTNCEPYADALVPHLRLRERPIVHLNAPSRVDGVALPEPHAGPLRAIYQAASDLPGRPLVDLLTAAEHAPGVRITLRVVDLDRDTIEREITARGIADRLELVPPVPVTGLIDGLRGFDVGIIVRRALTANDELPVPGKLFEYMMAGLAVVCPRLPGLVPIVEGEEIGLLYEPSRPETLGEALAELAADPARVHAMQRRGRELAMERFNAEAEMRQLLHAWGAEQPAGQTA